MCSLKDKVIAITGAASGIGLETARVCAERGARLALSDVQPDALERSIAELKAAFPNAEIIGTGVDVSNHESVNSWIAATVEHFGCLDGAANIAGMGGQKVFCNVEDEENENWDAIIRVNLTGTFYCLRAQLGVMKKGASIVNCASTTAFMGRPGIAAYSVSKHGIVGLTKAVAKEVGKRGIRVNAVAPGPTDTPMLQRLLSEATSDNKTITDQYDNIPLGRLGRPEELAKTFAFLLSDDSSWTTGTIYLVDGGVAS